MLYSPARRRLELVSPHDEFRIARMGALYARWLGDCRAAGADWMGEASYQGSQPAEDGSLVELRVGGRPQFVQARFLIAADGAQSRVAADLQLDTNRAWIVGLEEVFEGGTSAEPPGLHVFLDRRLAPGYIAWIAADGHGTHLGVGGYPSLFRPGEALAEFRREAGSFVPLDGARLVERRGGRIPVGGMLSRVVCPRGILVGDAAGAVSPLTAGGLDPCLRLSELAAKVTWQFLSTGDAALLAAYDGRRLRRMFRGRRMLRTAYGWWGHNPLLELACALMRTRPGRKLAEQVFFGRGSFPNVGHTSSPGAQLTGGASIVQAQ
jgi:flavin-dependent dehydrogenase